MKTAIRLTLLARRLIAQLSLIILFGFGTSFANSLPPAAGYVSASGSHARVTCAGACVLTPGSGHLAYDNSGAGTLPDGSTYTWAESADVLETLGPGIPVVGTMDATAASVTGHWANNQANSWAGAFSTFYFSVDQIKVPGFALIVLPIYFEANGEAHVDGYGSFDVSAAILTSTSVGYSIKQEGVGVSGSLVKLQR